MKIKSKAEYDEKQEFIDEIESKIVCCKEMFKIIDELVDNIKYVYEYDQERALELWKELRSVSRYVGIKASLGNGNFQEDLISAKEQFNTIAVYDADRASTISKKVIEHLENSGITFPKKELKKEE